MQEADEETDTTQMGSQRRSESTTAELAYERMNSLFQDRKQERLVPTTGSSNPISTADVYLEALEKAKESCKEPGKTGNNSKICVANCKQRSKNRLCKSAWSQEYGGNKRETNPISD